jgi:hypothetical protein
MKKCVNCGFENSDEATSCQSCSAETFVASSPDAIGGHIISLAEQRVWERMTFRQFAILFIRFQAIWFLPYAIDDVTYLATALANLHNVVGVAYSEERHYIFRLVFSIFWHVAAFIAFIRYAERIASWLIKDIIPKSPPNTALEPTAAAPSVSDVPGNPKAGGESTSASSGGGSALDR